MKVIWTPNGLFKLDPYLKEVDLEAAIVRLKRDLFGDKRIYLDIKKKLGRTIPDGYLIDLSSRKPKLYFVENELTSHDQFDHIAAQLHRFSDTFDKEKLALQRLLSETLHTNSESRSLSEDYCSQRGYRGVDHLVTELVFEAPFAAIVIINDVSEGFKNLLVKQIRFDVQTLGIARYIDSQSQHIFMFEPFLSNLGSLDSPTGTVSYESAQISNSADNNTLIVAAAEEGFQNTFLAEHRWHHVRISERMRSRIQYIAVYRKAPVSAVTHIAPVSSIHAWENTDKFVLNFSEPAHEIKRVVGGKRLTHIQNTMFTNLNKLLMAKTLDDL